jgi:hypothetical protein
MTSLGRRIVSSSSRLICLLIHPWHKSFDSFRDSVLKITPYFCLNCCQKTVIAMGLFEDLNERHESILTGWPIPESFHCWDSLHVRVLGVHTYAPDEQSWFAVQLMDLSPSQKWCCSDTMFLAIWPIHRHKSESPRDKNRFWGNRQSITFRSGAESDFESCFMSSWESRQMLWTDQLYHHRSLLQLQDSTPGASQINYAADLNLISINS